MVIPNFDLGSQIKLVKGIKPTDKQMIEYNGRIIMPKELTKMVLLLIMIEDEKWPRPKFDGGNLFQNYLGKVMTSRNYEDPPMGRIPRNTHESISDFT